LLLYARVPLRLDDENSIRGGEIQAGIVVSHRDHRSQIASASIELWA
jgi:hypothetical protein